MKDSTSRDKSSDSKKRAYDALRRMGVRILDESIADKPQHGSQSGIGNMGYGDGSGFEEPGT